MINHPYNVHDVRVTAMSDKYIHRDPNGKYWVAQDITIERTVGLDERIEKHRERHLLYTPQETRQEALDLLNWHLDNARRQMDSLRQELA